MCLIVFAHNANERHRLIVAANRDEVVDRPTAPMAFWPDHPTVLAGRDLKSNGTWMGMERSGRFAAVTNIRRPNLVRPQAASRGRLVSDFLTDRIAPMAYLTQIASTADKYNGFNLLVADSTTMGYLNSESAVPELLPPGIYGLSNERLDTPWPKVVRARTQLASLITAPALSAADLLPLLADRYRPPDEELPDTGVGLERERMLSPVFITGRHYGTRSSTALTWGRDGQVLVEERTIANPVHPERQRRRAFFFEIPSSETQFSDAIPQTSDV